MAKQYHRLLKANLAHGAMSVFKKSWEMRNRGLYKNPLKRPLLPGWGLALEGLTLRFSMKKKRLYLAPLDPSKRAQVMKEKLCDATGANQYMDLASQLLGSNKKQTEIGKIKAFDIRMYPSKNLKKLEPKKNSLSLVARVQFERGKTHLPSTLHDFGETQPSALPPFKAVCPQRLLACRDVM